MTSLSTFIITAVVIVIDLVIVGIVTILLVLNQLSPERNILLEKLNLLVLTPRLKGVQKLVFIVLSEMKITSVLIMRMTQKEYMLQRRNCVITPKSKNSMNFMNKYIWNW